MESVWNELGEALYGSQYDTHWRWSWGDPELEMGWDLQAACMNCNRFIMRVVLRFSKDLYQWNVISEVLGHGPEDAWRWCQWQHVLMEGLMSLNIWSDGFPEKCCSIPCDNRNHSRWAIAVSWVQPCNLAQWSDKQMSMIPLVGVQILWVWPTAGMDLPSGEIRLADNLDEIWMQS